MKPEQIVEALVQTAQQLDWHVRFERGNFRGGPCMLDGRRVIMLNKRHSTDLQISILAESLREEAVDQVFLQPAARHALENAWERLDTASNNGHDA